MMKPLRSVLFAAVVLSILALSCKKTDTGKSFTLTYQLTFDGTLINAPTGGSPNVQYTYTGYLPRTDIMSAGVSSWSQSIQVTNASSGVTFNLNTPSPIFFATTIASPTIKAEIIVDGTTRADQTVNATAYTTNIATGTVNISYTTP
jgi:hypothetical protein